MDISVVIATRNRADSLATAIRSMANQTQSPVEIIVVDASDDPQYAGEFPVGAVPVRWIFTPPSVCRQRNVGIQSATADWIFICDDDIELEPKHFELLSRHLSSDPSCGAVAGLLLQQEGGQWVRNYPVKSFKELLWKFIFQLSIWGEIDVKPPILMSPLYQSIKRFYVRRGNTTSLAGWPLITQWSDRFHTKFYSLGATLVKREWLLHSPFDESLDAHGIGDNYGVAMNFPDVIHVVTDTFAYHHRSSVNRLESTTARMNRIKALDYFLKKGKASFNMRLFFKWSVVSFVLYTLVRDRKNFARSLRLLVR